MIFPVLYLSNIFTAVRARTSTSRGLFFVFSGSCSQQTSTWYHMIRNVLMVFVVFWGTLLRPTAGAVVRIGPKMHHPAKCSVAMCDHTRGVLRDFIVVIHRDICREHSLIGRRNCLMTEASSSL